MELTLYKEAERMVMSDLWLVYKLGQYAQVLKAMRAIVPSTMYRLGNYLLNGHSMGTP